MLFIIKLQLSIVCTHHTAVLTNRTGRYSRCGMSGVRKLCISKETSPPDALQHVDPLVLEHLVVPTWKFVDMFL